MSIWTKKKEETLKFVYAASKIWIERNGNLNVGVDRQGRMEKGNKTIGTEKSENIETLRLKKEIR